MWKNMSESVKSRTLDNASYGSLCGYHGALKGHLLRKSYLKKSFPMTESQLRCDLSRIKKKLTELKKEVKT